MPRTVTVNVRHLGAVFLVAALAFASSILLEREAETRTRPQRLERVPRARLDTIRVPGALSVADFTGNSERLLLLDRRAARVIDVRRDSQGNWRSAHLFGRAGEGPGEFAAPRGIAQHGREIVVSDRGRLHVFDRAGNFIRTIHPRLPCAATRLYVADSHARWLLAAECFAGDTMFAALLSSADGKSYELLARDSRFTITGKWGSHFFALRALSDVAGGVLFGVGRTPCVRGLADRVDSGVWQVCGRLMPYTSKAPPGFQSAGPPAQRWPKKLPYFVDRTMIGNSIGVWRPFSPDSMVLELLDSGRAVLVAGLSAFVACRRAGCLWAQDETQSTRLLFLPSLRTH